MSIRWLAALIVALAILSAAFGAALHDLLTEPEVVEVRVVAPAPPAPVVEHDCLLFSAFYNEPQSGQLVRVGETVLCGAGLVWAPTYGPDIETWQRSIEGLLHDYRQCFHDKICGPAVVNDPWAKGE